MSKLNKVDDQTEAAEKVRCGLRQSALLPVEFHDPSRGCFCQKPLANHPGRRMTSRACTCGGFCRNRARQETTAPHSVRDFQTV